jgi:hypothetical protein
MSTPATVRSRVRLALDRAWAAAEAAGTLPAHPGDVPPPQVEVERPAKPEHGDLATNLAMKLARPLRRPPLAIATAIVEALATSATDSASPIAEATVAPPGFINIRLSDGLLTETIDGVLAGPEVWGRTTATRPRVVNVEFVSANPTGPLTIGNARGAFVGDLLCRVLAAGGQQVTREYYFNDSGGQIDRLGASMGAPWGEPIPEDGYHGPTPAFPWPCRRRPVRRRSRRRADATRPLQLGGGTVRRHRGESRAARRPLTSGSEGSPMPTAGSGERSSAPRARPPYEQVGTWFRSTEFGDDK